MNKTLRLSILGISLGVAFLAGCELIVDFDRTQIPADATDATVPPRDSATGDSAVIDAAVVADSGEGGSDASTDATTDSSDASADANDDASNDAGDAGD